MTPGGVSWAELAWAVAVVTLIVLVSVFIVEETLRYPARALGAGTPCGALLQARLAAAGARPTCGDIAEALDAVSAAGVCPRPRTVPASAAGPYAAYLRGRGCNYLPAPDRQAR